MPVLHQMQMSGNCYKVRLTARQLGVPITLKEYPLHAGDTRKPAFLAKNPNGRVPLLEFEDGRMLPESDAIIWYLAESTKLAPESKWDRAQALQWMFFEQYSHEPFIATSRFWIQHKPDSPEKTALLASKRDGGWAALKIMETHLAKNDFFVSDYNIADIALFAYTHVAHEGGFLLDEFPNLREWIERVKTQPGFVPMR
jgi:glutathione S-transferase